MGAKGLTMSQVGRGGPPLGQLYWRSLVRGLEGVRKRFDGRSGRFLVMPDHPPRSPERRDIIGWAVTHQDVILALAALYATDGPDNPLHRSDELLTMIVGGGNAIRDFQNPDGTVDFVKPDGSDWGPTYMGWTNYHWLETYVLMRDHLPDDVRRRWEEGLTLAHEGQTSESASDRIHNIPTWKAMSCWRAGQVFGNERWQRYGARQIERTVAAQHPGGFWFEHRGPTTSYNRVYLHALGLCWIYTQEPRVLEAVERAIEFHLIHSYPDGTGVETVDGRTKYSGARPVMGLVALGLTPEGRHFARRLMEPGLGSTADAGKPAGAASDLSACCTPHMATAFLHAPDGPESPSVFDQPDRRYVWRDMSLTLRTGPWFACCSSLVVPPSESFWGQDRQHFVSLWCEGHGLLIGKGNSRNQPEWSTFVVAGRDGRRYLPDRAGLLSDGVWLDYGRTRCIVRVDLSAERARIGAAVTGASEPARLQLQLRLGAGMAVRGSDGARATLSSQPVRLDEAAGVLTVEPAGWSIELPRRWSLDWPVAPFNPYAKDGSAPPEQAAGILGVDVPAAGEVWLTVRRGEVTS